MHQLSVTGDIDFVIESISFPQNIKADISSNTVVFSSDEESEIKFLKQRLADVIAAIIETKYQDNLMKQIIDRDHHYFTNEEQTDIFTHARQATKPVLSQKVLPRLREFLSCSDNISIEGFVNFRLQDYKQELKKAVEKAAENFLVMREYDEFISLLEYFVSTQEPGEANLHVVVTPGGGYSIYNSALREITHQCAKEITDLYSGDEISFDDILISSLISIAPKKLTFHKSGYIKTPQLLETIEKVFKERVFFCEECPLCNIHHN